MHVTVCIITRDRGESIAQTLRTIVASTYTDFDVVIVDQSTADDTANAVSSVARGDSRFTYVRSQTVGSSTARNVALSYAHGPLVAFTDDDCEVPLEWLHLIVHHFVQDKTLGQICGEVRVGPHDPNLGFVPDYHVPRLKLISSPWLKWREGGIGANMAFRLDVLRAVGPFDEVLGAGRPLCACDDGDMTYRVLKAGYGVLSVPDLYVIHNGFRTWQQGKTLMRRTGVGVGAAYMKHLRLGDVAVLPTLTYELMRCINWKRLLLLQRRSGVARFLSFAKGMRISFNYSIDPRQRTYIMHE